MPIRIRWGSKDYLPIALMLLGSCGIFQLLFIFIAQYFFGIGNYLVTIIIPIAITIALFFASVITFEAFAQVERRETLKRPFSKSKRDLSKFNRFLKFPVVRPLFIIFIIFLIMFFGSYFFSLIFWDKIISFLVAENFSAVICFLIANLIEKNYAKVRRY
ncbi:MAG: hypothetical protein ACFE85_13450 [Candidatus Hodarchaeota archaeon]